MSTQIDEQPEFMSDHHSHTDSQINKELQKEAAARDDAVKRAEVFIAPGSKSVEVPIVLVKAVLGEMLATFIFTFVVEATVVNFSRLQTLVNPVIGAVATAFCAVAVIYSFADVSGANFNPAVTFATWICGKVSFTKFVFYVCAQVVGSLLSGMMLLLAFPGLEGPALVVVKRGADVSVYEAFIMETVLTFILVYVIFATAFDSIPQEKPQEIDLPEDVEAGSSGARPRLTVYTTSGDSKSGFAPIAIGFTLGFLSFIGGTVSGGSYNPVRSFGVAVLSRQWQDQWIYWLGPFLGAGMAGYVQMIFSHTNPDPLIMVKPIISWFKREKRE